MGTSGTGRDFVILLVLMLIFTSCSSLITADEGAEELPNSPMDLMATPGNGNALLTWSPPQFSNGSAIQEYWIYRGSAAEMSILTTLGNVTNYLDTGLANGKEYTYAVKAINLQGAGNLSNTVTVTPRTVPSAPLNPRAIPGDRFLNLTWEIPNWNGGATIMGYTIYEIGSSGPLGTSSDPYFIHSLLEPLSYHTYVVTAFNVAGEGTSSVIFAGTADTIPGVPANITVVGGVNNVTLTWEPPTYNDGSGPSGYKIYRGNGSEEMSLLLALSSDRGNFTDFGLSENNTYCYTVSSFNLVGESERTVPIWAQVYGLAEINITSIIEGDGQVDLFWQVEEQWSSQVIRYWIYRGDSLDSMTLLRSNLSEGRYTDIGLNNGQEYFYRVATETAAGLGWSQNVSATPHRVPYSPLGLNATGNDGYIILNWEPPEDDGGSTILSYKIYMGPDGQTPTYLADVGTTYFTCAGLASGSTYGFQVSAVNSAGEGNLSEVVEEMCGKVPSSPNHINSLSGQGYVMVTWDPPTDPGTVPVQTYEVRRTDGQNTFSMTLVERLWNDTSVTNGATYQYNVRAINEVGEGPWSDIVEGTPDWTGGIPGAPLNLTATSGQDYISLSWNIPSDGGHDISGYLVYRGITPDLIFYMTTVLDEQYNDTDLSLGSTYYYKVVAENIVGQGPESDLVNATTIAPEIAEKNDLWTMLLTTVIPLMTLVIIAVVGIILLVRRKLVGRRGKEQKKRAQDPRAKKGTPPKRPATPEPVKQSKEKDKGGRWD